jgi:autotransporter-associated beta strand protein
MSTSLLDLLKIACLRLHPLGVGAWALRILVLIVIALQFGSGMATAQTTWNNTGTEWTSGPSWIGDSAPSSSATTVGNTAVFSNVGVGFNSVNLSSDRNIYGVLFTAGANAYSFTGGALTFNGAYGISNLSANVQTFSNKVRQTANNGAIGSYTAGGSLVLAGGIDLSATAVNRTLTLGGIGDITVSGAIADGGTATAANVTITNTALTIFSGNNTYGGATTVQSGATLRLGSATALGTTNGSTTVTGALDLNGQTIGQEALSISGTGVSSGGVIFNSSASAASASGPVTMTASSTIKATNGSITLSGGFELVGNAASSRTLTLDGTGGLILSGNISNSFAGSTGNIAIAATASNITLSGSNSYNGTTTLTAGGAMNINSAYAISTNTFTIGTSSFLNNTSGGAITNLGNNNVTLGDGLTFGTSGSAATNSLNLGTGTATASSSRTITIAGTGVTLGLGTLDSTSTSTGRTFTANGAGNILSLAGWKIQSGSTANVTATLAGTADWTITGPIVNGNAFSNGVQIDATGLTTFGGNNTYDGETIVSSGATLLITSATGLGTTNTGTTVSAGGQLQLSGGITVDAGEALSLSGTTGATASLRNISGDNTYNGAVTFAAGTNRIDSDAGTLILSSFANTLSSTRSLFVGGAGNTVLTGRLTGSGTSTVTKDGSGTLTLANTNFDVVGGFIVSAGALALATNDALGAARAVAVNGGTLDIGAFNNTVGAVSLTNGTISGSTGILTGTSYAVENGSISATLAGSGGLTKSTAGTVTLSGANTYSGGTVVSAGELAYGVDNALANSGAVTVSNATLNIGSYSDTVGAVVVTDGGRLTGTTGVLTGSSYDSGGEAVTNTISANLAGSAALTLTGNTNTTVLSGSNSYSGDTTLANSTSTNMTLRVTSVNALSTNSSLVGSSASSRLPTLDLAAAGAYTMQNYKGGNMTFLATNGASSITFANDSVTNQITGGSRNLYATNVNVTFQGALDISPTAADKDLGFRGNGDYTLNGSIVTADTGFTAGMVVDTTGTVALNASNNYNGTTTVRSSATLLLGNDNALGTTDSGTTVLSGGALDLGGSAISGEALSVEGTGVSSGGAIKNSSGSAASFSGPVTLTAATTIATTNGNIEISGAIGQDSGSRNLEKTGASTLTLSGTSANNYLGRTTVSGGVLALNKTVGVDAIAGAVTVSSTATLLISASDQVNNSSAITLSGGTITRASGVSETFGNLNITVASTLNFGSGTAGSLAFGTYSRDTESALLTVQNFFQGNSLVFSQDLVTSGLIASSSSGNYDNGYFAFADGFTTSWNSGTSTFTITAIPEPSTYLAAAGLIGLMLWPSRRRLLKDAKSILGLRAPARERCQAPHGKA